MPTYEERLRALAAATPAAAAPPGMLEYAAALALLDSARAVLHVDERDPSLPRAEVLQACVDYLRGVAAASAAVDMVFALKAGAICAALGLPADADISIRRIRGATAAELRAEPPLEADFLEHFLVVVVLMCLKKSNMHAARAVPLAEKLVPAAAAATALWCKPAPAARRAARLAELGGARSERAAADLCFALCAAAVGAPRRLPSGAPAAAVEERARLLELAVAANPGGLSEFEKLARAYLYSAKPRRALATIERALARVEAAGGGGLAAVQLACSAFDALTQGARGPWWRARDARPLLDRAQRLLDGCREWMPRAAWEARARSVDLRRADLQRVLDGGAGDDSRLPPRPAWDGIPNDDHGVMRVCAACGKVDMEMPQCSRCRGTPAQVHYGSPTCQGAHWPDHKAACRAAEAGAAAPRQT